MIYFCKDFLHYLGFTLKYIGHNKPIPELQVFWCHSIFIFHRGIKTTSFFFHCLPPHTFYFPAWLLYFQITPLLLLFLVFIWFLPRSVCKFGASQLKSKTASLERLVACRRCVTYSDLCTQTGKERRKQKPQSCSIKHKWGQYFHRGWHGSSNQGLPKTQPPPFMVDLRVLSRRSVSHRKTERLCW